MVNPNSRNHVEELRDLVRLGFWFEFAGSAGVAPAERANVMAAADLAYPKPDTFDEAPEFEETDIAQIAPAASLSRSCCRRRERIMGPDAVPREAPRVQSPPNLQTPPVRPGSFPSPDTRWGRVATGAILC